MWIGLIPMKNIAIGACTITRSMFSTDSYSTVKWKILMLQTLLIIIKWWVRHLKWNQQNVHH